MRELGARAVPVFAAIAPTPTGGKQLLAVERLPRGAAIRDEEAANYIRDARRISEVDHPNLVRVRDVVIRPSEIYVVTDFLDGERLGRLLRSVDSPALGLELGLRVLVDALTGLGALHNLRDAKKVPLRLVHGEVTPANVIVGVDGNTRLVHPCWLRTVALRPKAPVITYLAPEVLLANAAVDPRADVYSVGAILWEMLSGKPIFEETDPQVIVGHVMAGRTPRALAPEGVAWAEGLSEVAARALAANPDQRFPHAAAMAADIRKVIGPKLATVARVAAFMKASYGGAIAARRVRLEAGDPAPAAKLNPGPRPDPDEPTLDRPLPAEVAGAPVPSAPPIVPTKPIVLGAPTPISSKEVEAVREMVAAAAKAALGPGPIDDPPSSVATGPVPVPKPAPPQPDEPSVMVSDEIKDEVTEERTLDPRVAARAREALRSPQLAIRRPTSGAATKPEPAPPPKVDPEGDTPIRPAPISIKTPLVAYDPQIAMKAAGAAEPMGLPKLPDADDAGDSFPDLPPMRARMPTSPSIISMTTAVRQRRTRRALAFVSGGLIVVAAALGWRTLKLRETHGSQVVVRESVVNTPIAAQPVPTRVDPVAARPTSPPPEPAALPAPLASSSPAPLAPSATSVQPLAAADDVGSSGPAHPAHAITTPSRGASHPPPASRPTAAPRAPRPTRPKVFDPTAI